MFDWVPLSLYSDLYHYILLFVVFFTLVQTYTQPLTSVKTVSFNRNLGFFTFIFILLYIGLRPISGVFTDMATYNRIFENYAFGAEITSSKDYLFHVFTKFCAQVMTAQMYFFLCAVLYITPLYLVCKKWFKVYWFYAFLFLIGAFSFWAYGTNGIRNGIAGSLFLLAISRDKRIWQIILIVLAVNFHKTMLLPSVGFILANFYNQPKKMIVFWLLCIPLSLLGGGFFETFFASLGFEDDRLSYLTDGNINNDNFSSTVFRWDFLLYSATAIFAGWYFIVKRKFNDKIYFLLFNTYIFANAFWVLVIRANFSNRFAYLSWFMMGLIIIYPLLKKQIIPEQHKRIGLILLFYFAFTFLMNVILS